MMRRFTPAFHVLPVWWRPIDGAWHRSRGPVQFVGRAAFENPARYPMTVMLASVAAVQFYLAAFLAIAVCGAGLWFSPGALLGLLVVLVAGRRVFSRHWLAARYALALNLTRGCGEVLFWAKLLAGQTGLNHGAARDLLERWIDLTAKGVR
jgi:hypothetical protein